MRNTIYSFACWLDRVMHAPMERHTTLTRRGRVYAFVHQFAHELAFATTPDPDCRICPRKAVRDVRSLPDL